MPQTTKSMRRLGRVRSKIYWTNRRRGGVGGRRLAVVACTILPLLLREEIPEKSRWMSMMQWSKTRARIGSEFFISFPVPDLVFDARSFLNHPKEHPKKQGRSSKKSETGSGSQTVFSWVFYFSTVRLSLPQPSTCYILHHRL